MYWLKLEGNVNSFLVIVNFMVRCICHHEIVLMIFRGIGQGGSKSLAF